MRVASLLPLLLLLLVLVLLLLVVLTVALLIGLIVPLRVRLLLAICIAGFTAAHHRMTLIIITVVEGFTFSRLHAFRPGERLLLPLAELFLRRSDQAEIVFGMLVVILGRYRISRGLRVASQLNVFFGDM